MKCCVVERTSLIDRSGPSLGREGTVLPLLCGSPFDKACDGIGCLSGVNGGRYGRVPGICSPITTGPVDSVAVVALPGGTFEILIPAPGGSGSAVAFFAS